MSDYLFIFIGIFILIIIIVLFALIGYIYITYKSYTDDIDENLSESETTINNTSKAFNKLQDNVITELAKITDSQNNIISDYPQKATFLDKNLLSLFEISSNTINYETLSDSTITADAIRVKPTILTAGNITSLTTSDKLLHICDSKTDANKATRQCISMNLTDGIFNIYTSNTAFSGAPAKNIAIHNNDNTVLANFNAVDKKILLGSGDDTAAISIVNNIYTPNIIIGSYSFTAISGDKPAKLNLSYISNFTIKENLVINFLLYEIPTRFTINTIISSPVLIYSSIQIVENILKLTVNASKTILKNVINTIPINITAFAANETAIAAANVATNASSVANATAATATAAAATAATDITLAAIAAAANNAAITANATAAAASAYASSSSITTSTQIFTTNGYITSS
jgi:hypothetical protein